MDNPFVTALKAAKAQRDELIARLVMINQLIENLNQVVEDSANELDPPPGYVPTGLTDEIRKILTLTSVHMDAIQIRDALIQRNFQYSSAKNLLISVHTVLVRIKDELDEIQRGGKSAYQMGKKNVGVGRSTASGTGIAGLEAAAKAIGSATFARDFATFEAELARVQKEAKDAVKAMTSNIGTVGIDPKIIDAIGQISKLYEKKETKK